MNDPAVEAARRAFCILWPDQGDPEFDFIGRQRDWAILAAREVLIVAWPSIKKAVEDATLAHINSLMNQTSRNVNTRDSVSNGADAALDLAVAINDSILSKLFPNETSAARSGRTGT